MYRPTPQIPHRLPAAAPPKNLVTKVRAVVDSCTFAPEVAAATSTVNITSAVSKLNRLSPSSKAVRSSGAPDCLNGATTATGSVADKITPHSRAASHAKPVSTLVRH